VTAEGTAPANVGGSILCRAAAAGTGFGVPARLAKTSQSSDAAITSPKAMMPTPNRLGGAVTGVLGTTGTGVAIVGDSPAGTLVLVSTSGETDSSGSRSVRSGDTQGV
jgi:hypothetical protein